MIFKNLLRRKGRTFITILSISIGVAAMIALGALADGLGAGYDSMITGSDADLALSQPDSFDLSYNSIDESIGAELDAMPEIAAVSGMITGIIPAQETPYFFLFGYPVDSFLLDRFQIIDGIPLDDPKIRHTRGTPLLLGSSAAESLHKTTGDTLRLGSEGGVYRVVGIYETGNAFEDGGGVLELKDAQDLTGKPRQVSVFYIRLKDRSLKDRLITRVERQYSDLTIGGVDEFSNDQMMAEMLGWYVWAIAGLAIIIGGVGMMNSQLMAVFERTREIGVLRAVGWRKWRVLSMILRESVVVSLLGGALGIGLGWLLIYSTSAALSAFGTTVENITSGLIIQASIVTAIIGVFGGVYPAWNASRLPPIEALRYEGGSGGKVRRLPIGGMALQSLWQRITRTMLTVLTIALTIGGIMALEGFMGGFTDMFDASMASNAEIMIRQADIADTSLSAIDERVGDKIAAMPEVQSVSGMIFSAVVLPESSSFMLIEGYAPNEYGIRRFNVIEGKPLTGNRQILLGKQAAEAMHAEIGETIELQGSRFRVVGIFETGTGWEDSGGVVSLRDGQNLVGRSRKVTMFSVKLHDPSQAEALVEEINATYPEAYATLAGDFVDQMPDMEASDAMIWAISFLAILVGGLGVMNTMLMAVLERTREIGVLRSLGWRRRAIMGMILKESILLSIIGAAAGILCAFGLSKVLNILIGSMMQGADFYAIWTIEIFLRSVALALLLGSLGGLYPAFRATRLQPIEALRYE